MFLHGVPWLHTHPSYCLPLCTTFWPTPLNLGMQAPPFTAWLLHSCWLHIFNCWFLQEHVENTSLLFHFCVGSIPYCCDLWFALQVYAASAAGCSGSKIMQSRKFAYNCNSNFPLELLQHDGGGQASPFCQCWRWCVMCDILILSSPDAASASLAMICIVFPKPLCWSLQTSLHR